MLIYDDAEQAYLRWVQAHPNGYVLNAPKGEGKVSYAMLHRATCRSISSDQHTNYTTTSYTKVCSLKKQELVDWGRKHSRNLKECSLCKP